MKYIKKNAVPYELQAWINSQRDVDGRPINRDYENGISTAVKDAIRSSLLHEQGYLCCYTGMRINMSNSHIEHVKPQSLCIKGIEDIDYNNMLAAYPRKQRGESECPFGADIRRNWYDAKLFISPLHKQCEKHFRFDAEGYIYPARDTDIAAKTTIEKLRLNHERLDEMRKSAIDEALFSDNEPISSAKLRGIIHQGFSERDGQGRFPRFCFVIEQVAAEVLHKVERNRQRKKAIRKQSHR